MVCGQHDIAQRVISCPQTKCREIGQYLALELLTGSFLWSNENSTFVDVNMHPYSELPTVTRVRCSAEVEADRKAKETEAGQRWHPSTSKSSAIPPCRPAAREHGRARTTPASSLRASRAPLARSPQPPLRPTGGRNHQHVRHGALARSSRRWLRAPASQEVERR